MTENEALECLKSSKRKNDMLGILPGSDIGNTIIKALEELRQYRAIGTLEECRTAMEKQTEKKISSAWCPSCKRYLTTQHLKRKYHCVYCGQKLDWSDEE